MSGELVDLAPGVYCWLAGETSHSHTNSGIVIAQDGLSVIDAGPTPAVSAPLTDALAALTPLPIRRFVLSGSHIDVAGGAAAFPLAAVYGREQTSVHLDQPPNPEVWSALHTTHDFTEVVTRPVSHIIAEAAHVCAASIAVPVSGPQFENLVVQVPSANVVFAGLVASFKTVPFAFEADFPAWIATLDQLVTLGEIFIPAHGPVGGAEEVADLRRYLEACLEANGNAAAMAAGPWSNWANSGYTPINVERAALLAQGDPSPPPSLLRLLGL